MGTSFFTNIDYCLLINTQRSGPLLSIIKKNSTKKAYQFDSVT